MMTSEERSRKGKQASVKGFANESRLLAALLDREFNASKVDLPHSPYDIVVELKKGDYIRVQVKTIGKNSNTIQFRGGIRGGVDRKYISDAKHYTQSPDTSDIIVGIKTDMDNGDNKTDFYFVPTILIKIIDQKSISANKIKKWKNGTTANIVAGGLNLHGKRGLRFGSF